MNVKLTEDTVVAGSIELAGAVLNVEATEAATLIRRGLAEPIKTEAVEVVTETTEADTEETNNG